VSPDYRPAARRDGILSERLDDELLVFDTAAERAHSLNPTATRVFEACDGTASVAEIAAALELEVAVIEMSLDTLAKNGLLRGPTPVLVLGRSRRELLRRAAVAGGAASVALPIIRSIAVPTMAMASVICAPSRTQLCGGPTDPARPTGSYCSAASYCQPGAAGRKTTALCSCTSQCSFLAGHCISGKCGV
jgi:hypothetical protein